MCRVHCNTEIQENNYEVNDCNMNVVQSLSFNDLIEIEDLLDIVTVSQFFRVKHVGLG